MILSILKFIILFATPKKRTSKSKSRSRFSHWLSKPENMLKQLISSGKKIPGKISLKDKSVGFGVMIKKKSITKKSDLPTISADPKS